MKDIELTYYPMDYFLSEEDKKLDGEFSGDVDSIIRYKLFKRFNEMVRGI